MRPVPVWSVVLVAPLAALAVWAVAVPVAGVDLVVPGPEGSGGSRVGPGAIVVTAVLVVLAAWPVRTLFARRADRAQLDPCATPVGWRVTCAVVLAISLLGPLGALSAGAVIALSAMHAVVGAVVVGGLDPRHARRASTSSPEPVAVQAPTR